MVTIRSSIASFERGAFQATGSRQLPCDDALLLAYILCTLICVSPSPCIVIFLSHVPNWQYPPFTLPVPRFIFKSLRVVVVVVWRSPLYYL